MLSLGAVCRASVLPARAAPARKSRRESTAVRCAHSKSGGAPGAGHFEALVTALDAHTKLEVGHGSRGRGLFAAADVYAEDTVLSIPLRHVMCVAAKPEKGTRVADSLQRRWTAAHEGKLPWQLAQFLRVPTDAGTRMAAWLLHATREVEPYSNKVLPMLPGPEVVQICEVARLGFNKAHEMYLSELGRVQGLVTDPQAFQWALANVCTRTFTAVADNEELAMYVPLADILNHSKPPNCDFRCNLVDGTFEVIALEDIPKGEEACICYSMDASDAEIFARYGFNPALSG